MAAIVKFRDLEYDNLISVEQQGVDELDRPDVANKYRKLLFFVFREGFIRTWNKIRSKTKKEFLLEKKYTLIVLGLNGKRYSNFSIQTAEDKENFVIRNSFQEQSEPLKFSEITDKKSFNQFVENSSVTIALTIKNSTNENKGEIIENDKGVFIYGLGDYSRVYIAPNIKKLTKLFCVDYNFSFSKYYKERFGYRDFGLVPEDSYDALSRVKDPLAIIATYHSDHARIADEIFNTNSNALIFIEKPPVVTLNDLRVLVGLYDRNARLEIGYNRRFIPINKEIRNQTFHDQKVITISVKEILINESHWYFWKNQGTRITGNLTHWIDLAVFWINGPPIEINVLNSPSKDETIAVSILFSEGSLVNITVSDKGESMRGVQEHIEIRTKDETYRIEDYIKFTRIRSNGRKVVKRNLIRVKGHDLMYKHLTEVYTSKEEVTYTKEDLVKSALTTYYVSKMYTEGTRNLKINTSEIFPRKV
jgi:predicted dehydrogenase